MGSESFFGSTGTVLDLVRAQLRCEAGVFSSAGMLEVERGARVRGADGRKHGRDFTPLSPRFEFETKSDKTGETGRTCVE